MHGCALLDSFFICLGLIALNFYFASSLHFLCSSSGSLFFTHLGGINLIVHSDTTDPNFFIFILFIHTQLHINFKIQVSTYECLG